MLPDKNIWVIDTSSIVEIRRKFQKSDQIIIYNSLSSMVTNGTLVYPIEVYKELERGTNKENMNEDLPYKFALDNKKRATKYGYQFDTLAEILSHPHVSNIVDNEKIGTEEADPHVLALAMYLKNQDFNVTVITQEIKDTPFKLSMSSACGILQLYSIPIAPFVRSMNFIL
jgi:hypothetical protein